MDIEREKEKIESIITKARRFLYKAPEGNLIIANNKGYIQFYFKDITGKRTYLPKDKSNEVKNLIKKQYSEMIVKELEIEKTRIEHFLKYYNPNKSYEIYERFPKEIQELIIPYELSDEAYAEQWAAEKYETKGVRADETFYTTEQGEKVRSKSELTIANKLFIKGIKYRYEQPRYLKGYGTVYPDFTLLNKHTRQEVFLEHFGLMNNPDYAESFVRKINTYAKNGITPGHGLICTFETANQCLDTKQLDIILEPFL